jgi:hypothetical protein
LRSSMGFMLGRMSGLSKTPTAMRCCSSNGHTFRTQKRLHAFARAFFPPLGMNFSELLIGRPSSISLAWIFA